LERARKKEEELPKPTDPSLTFTPITEFVRGMQSTFDESSAKAAKKLTKKEKMDVDKIQEQDQEEHEKMLAEA